MKNFTWFLIIFLCCFPSISNGQEAEYYYSDNEAKDGTKINCYIKYGSTIIIGGMGYETKRYQPFVSRIDTLGNSLWSTTDFDTSTYFGPVVYIQKMILGIDSFLYVTCKDQGNGARQIWKVNVLNGVILWKKPFNLPHITTSFLGVNNGMPEHLVDYDSAKFIIAYKTQASSNVQNINIAYINKLTGDTISTHALSSGTTNQAKYGICLDSLKNIYFSKNDSIYKISSLNPSAIFWKTKHTVFQSYHYIYYDHTNSALFYVGTGPDPNGASIGKIIKINPANGALISTWASSNYSAGFHEAKFQNGFMFVCWSQLTVGGTPPCYITKYNLNTATAVWSTFPLLTGAGSQFNLTQPGSNQSGISIDPDNNGDIYMTGYYNAQNAGPGKWGILKINGNTGSKIYEKTVAMPGAIYNELSSGIGAAVINNKAYFVGDVETYFVDDYRRSSIAFVNIDPANGTILNQKIIGGTYKFPSQTLQIKNYPDGGNVVLKQIGRRLKLERYDLYKNLVWENYYTKEYFLYGADLEVNPNGNILFSAWSKRDTTPFPYYSTITDTIYLFKVSNVGNLINTYKFHVGLQNSKPIGIVPDNNDELIVYYKNNNSNIYIRNTMPSMNGIEFNTALRYNPVVSKTKCVLNKDASTGYIIAHTSSSPSVRFVEFNKSPLIYSTSSTVITSWIQRVNYIDYVDSNKILICGWGFNNKESIGLFNTSTKDTIWTKILSLSTFAQAVKFVLNQSKTAAYVITSTSLNTAVRKISLSDGAEQWNYIYNGAANLNDYPQDIVLDSVRGQLIVTGLETIANNNTNVFVLVLDTTGIVLDTIIKTGNITGLNFGSCTAIGPKNSQWVGGTIGMDSMDFSAFLFEIDTCANTSSYYSYTICDSNFHWNNHTYTNSGIFKDSIQNFAGCDSIITLNLTFKNKTYSNHSYTVCDSLIWCNKTLKFSGTYLDTIPNSQECDSVITLNLVINNSSKSISYVTSCNKLIWNQDTLINSGTFVDTLTNSVGCDSIIILHLTINNSNGSTFNITSCDSFLWKNNTYYNSGVYNDSLINYYGCDSIITLNLNITHSSFGTLNVNSCGPFDWNGNILFTNGKYYDTILNSANCDSIIELNLTILTSSNSNHNLTACDSLIWNNKVYTTSGNYIDTISNSQGCDSIVFLYLDVNKSTKSFHIIQECNNYLWNGTLYDSSGTYIHTIQNSEGCDSLINLSLTINHTIVDSQYILACNNFNLNGKTYYSSGIYHDTLQSITGCDSILVLNLQITSIDTSLNFLSNTFHANYSFGNYQWLNCSNNFQIIPGETNQTFNPSINGSYAVKIEHNGCVDTSFCYSIVLSGIQNYQSSEIILIYPNPSFGIFTLETPTENSNYFEIVNVLGIKILNGELIKVKKVDLSEFQPGIYYMFIQGKAYPLVKF